MEPTYFVYPAFGIASPYLAFFLGVFAADRLDLYSEISSIKLFFIAIFPGLLLPSMFAHGASITIKGVTYYGYLESVFEFASFAGFVAVSGSVAPELFFAIRRKVLKDANGDR